MTQAWKIVALGTAAIVVFAVMIVNATAGNRDKKLTHDLPSNAVARASTVA